MLKLSEKQKEDILLRLSASIDDANQFYKRHLQTKYLERENVIEASAAYYNTKFKNLSKIPLTTSEVYDTIMWIMPPLVETFSSSDDVVAMQGQNAEDDKRAKKVQELLNYQTERLNDGFMNRYYWMLSALGMNIGFVKISWLQERKNYRYSAVVNDDGLAALQAQEDVTVLSSEMQQPGNAQAGVQAIYSVDYEQEVITENRPLIEVVPVTEISWASNTKKLKEAQFVKHQVRRTVDYLLKKEKMDVYFDIEKARQTATTTALDTVEQQKRDYVKEIRYDADDLRREITIDECYCQYPMDENGNEVDELHDWIFTVANESVLIGAQYNNLGRRHPFVELIAMPDPWNVVPKKGIVEILAEVQDIMTAMVRLFVRHLVVSNEGRRFVDKTVVDQDDLINESPDVGVTGDPRAAVFPMPQTTMSPLTVPFMQMMDSRRSKSIGVTEYNTGTTSANLNDTATGVTALIDQANKRIKLIARVMAETGYMEMYRYLIALNQRFPNQKMFVRLLNETIEVDPSDLEGKLDLVVNVGVGSANKQAEIQNTQLIMSVLEKVGTAYPGMVTADKAYNLVKMLLEQMGRKNVDDYVNNIDIQQSIQQMIQQSMAQSQDKKGDTKESLSASLDKMIIPAQIQALGNMGIKITPDDYIVDAKIKAALTAASIGGVISGGIEGAAPPAFAGGNQAGVGSPGGQAVPTPINLGSAPGNVQGY